MYIKLNNMKADDRLRALKKSFCQSKRKKKNRRKKWPQTEFRNTTITPGQANGECEKPRKTENF